MARTKKPDREHTWRQRLQRHATSGLSIAAFCAREAVSASSFHAWRRRLADRSRTARPEPPLFVPLHLDPHPPQPDQTPFQGVELELPQQVRLRFESLPDPEWLGRVVAALARLPRQEVRP